MYCMSIIDPLMHAWTLVHFSSNNYCLVFTFARLLSLFPEGTEVAALLLTAAWWFTACTCALRTCWLLAWTAGAAWDNFAWLDAKIVAFLAVKFTLLALAVATTALRWALTLPLACEDRATPVPLPLIWELPRPITLFPNEPVAWSWFWMVPVRPLPKLLAFPLPTTLLYWPELPLADWDAAEDWMDTGPVLDKAELDVCDCAENPFCELRFKIQMRPP